jgi:hypothetical protein
MATIEKSPKSDTVDRSQLLPAALRDDFPILSQTVHDDRPLVFLARSGRGK